MSPRPTDIRVFLAVLPDPGLRTALCRLGRRLLPPPAPGWRPVHARDLHLTLRFFGNLPPPGMDPAIPWRDRLCDASSELAARHSPFDVHCHRVALWPTRGSRTLVVSVSSTDALMALASEAEALAAALGFPAEARAWKPHITLARATAAAGSLPSAPIDWSALPPLRIGTLALLRSRPPPAATRYETLWQRRLA